MTYSSQSVNQGTMLSLDSPSILAIMAWEIAPISKAPASNLKWHVVNLVGGLVRSVTGMVLRECRRSARCARHATLVKPPDPSSTAE